MDGHQLACEAEQVLSIFFKNRGSSTEDRKNVNPVRGPLSIKSFHEFIYS